MCVLYITIISKEARIHGAKIGLVITPSSYCKTSLAEEEDGWPLRIQPYVLYFLLLVSAKSKNFTCLKKKQELKLWDSLGIHICRIFITTTNLSLQPNRLVWFGVIPGLVSHHGLWFIAVDKHISECMFVFHTLYGSWFLFLVTRYMLISFGLWC